MKKIESLQLIRAVAAIAVVFFHATILIAERSGIAPFGNVFITGNRGVDLFFVLSGFIIATVHRGDLGNVKRLHNYIFSRLSRIYPAVIIMTLLSVAVYMHGFGGVERGNKLSTENFISSILLLPQTTVPLVNVTWTLKYEMFFYALFALMLVRLPLGLLVIALWQMAAIVVGIAGLFHPLTIANFYFQPVVLDFGVGMLAALLFARIEQNIRTSLIVGSLVAATTSTIAVFGLFLLSPQAAVKFAFPISLCFGVSAAALILSLSILERAGRFSAPPAIAAIGDASYSIYLVHFSIISLVVARCVAHHITLTNVVSIGIVSISVIGGFAFHHYIDTPIQRLLRSKWKGRQPVLKPASESTRRQ